jgi:hypothetical protein
VVSGVCVVGDGKLSACDCSTGAHPAFSVISRCRLVKPDFFHSSDKKNVSIYCKVVVLGNWKFPVEYFLPFP